jgi:hypothetical protein
MAEEQMIQIVESALRGLGDEGEVIAAGQFMPRGHTGSLFAGGIVGDSLAGSAGGLADSIATVGGSMAGAHARDATTGLPGKMLVGVTGTHVYGFGASTRHSPAGPLAFRVPRADLEVKVHQRVNVRILELIETTTGSRIELEGNRLPVTHSKDVIAALES